MNDDNCKIDIIGSKSFNIEINFQDYSSIVANTFYFNYNRCKKQNQEIDKLKDSDSIAWFLVSSYYYSFFAANQIANLMGIFNLNFDDEEKNSLVYKSITENNQILKDFINDDTKNFYGELKINDIDKKVLIKCTSGGGKPHKLAWDNLLKVINGLSISDADLIAKSNKLKSILSEKNYWKKPSQIRNEWNYSDPSLYFQHNINYIAVRNKFHDNFVELKNWSLNRAKTPKNEFDYFITILYLYKFTKIILEEIKSDILNED
ncbi:hypothetical protein [Aliarcobacter butzleri]|uniref:hypothetical protein n=1 Tax=Aliarcobacter butzleri TaxID=28197 RepID=UPI003AF9C338